MRSEDLKIQFLKLSKLISELDRNDSLELFIQYLLSNKHLSIRKTANEHEVVSISNLDSLLQKGTEKSFGSCPANPSSSFKVSLPSIDNTSYYLYNNNKNINNKHQVFPVQHVHQTKERGSRIHRLPRRELLKVVKKKIPRSKSPVPTYDTGNVVDFWNNLDLKPCNERTKAYDEAIKWIKRATRGRIPIKAGRKFSYNEIKSAIQRLSISIHDPYYYPKSSDPIYVTLSQMTLGSFIYDKYSSTSWMIQYLDQGLRRANELREEDDKFPDVTQLFKSKYIDRVLGGIEPEGGFNDYDTSCFMKAAGRTASFFKTNRKKMDLHVIGGSTLLGFAKLVWEALERNVGDQIDKVTPGWICSDTTFHKRLPSFLFKEGVIQDRRESRV